jgi:hypothetical protein
MRNKKVLLLITFLGFLTMIFFWTYTVIAALIFIALSYWKHKISPLKSESLLWFSILLGGSIVEAVFVNYLKAWTYVKPDVFGIPLFMPFLWAFIGITIVSFYNELQNK